MKRFLKRVLPPSRSFVEWKFDETENRIDRQIKEISDILRVDFEKQQKELLKLQRNIQKRVPRKDFRLIVDLAEHCNLNCQSCDHFSPLAKEHYTDINEYTKDLTRIYEIMGDDISSIDFEGGEPLLNANIIEFIRVTRNWCPTTPIKILTNGIRLGEMNDEFWKACHEHNVSLKVTVYPIKIDYDRIKQLAGEKGVNWEYFDNGEPIKTTYHKPLDLNGGQDKYDSFFHCPIANGSCSMMKHGKLYPCTLIPNIGNFNNYFGKDLKVMEKDYIDLYSDCTKEDIYDFLCNPVPACRYCKTKEITYKHKWHTTKYQIGEWT